MPGSSASAMNSTVPGAVVARGLGQRDGFAPEPFAQLGRDDRRRRLLEHLLVAALERALAFAEREHGAVRVADHLHLDVPRARQEALDEHAVVAEAGRRLALRRGDRLIEPFGRLHDAHPASPAARGGLDQQRVGVRTARRLDAQRLHHRHARVRGRLLRAHLVAHQLDRLRRRPDEHDARLRARPRQRRVLGQEPVARVQRVRGRADDRLDVQVRRHPDRLVGLAHVRHAGVGVGVDGDAADPQPLQRADHAACDLAAVGDEDGREHQAPSARAITICCTSSVPSPMVRIFASRYMRHTGYSSM